MTGSTNSVNDMVSFYFYNRRESKSNDGIKYCNKKYIHSCT